MNRDMSCFILLLVLVAIGCGSNNQNNPAKLNPVTDASGDLTEDSENRFGGADYCSDAFGKRYCSEITSEAVSKAPKWGQNDENPPTSARKAITIADARRKELVKDNDHFRWRRTEATLIFDWDGVAYYWKVHYEAEIRSGGSTGGPPSLDLFVLMDGTLVEPFVSNAR